MLCNKGLLEKYRDELLQTLLHLNCDQILLVWNAYNEVVLTTKSIEGYFPVDSNEITNYSICSILPKDLINQIHNHFEKTSQSLIIPQHVISASQNKLINFSIAIKKLKLGSEFIYLCTMKDITEVKELKSRLVDMEKTILSARLSANVVHEIRNPLTAIKGFLQLLEAGIDHREQYVRVLLSEVEKIEGLTNELLQIANPHKNRKKLVTLSELLTDVSLLIKAQPRMKDIEIDMSGDLELSVYCNPNEIKQVLINLIVNGADAMNYKGEIEVKIKRVKEYAVIEIIDNGHGMSEKTLEKIHQAFYTTKEHGTGLGLVVAEDIIENHHGSLSISSIENIGSTFEISLPIATCY